MAHRPIFRPDPLQPPQLAKEGSFSQSGPQWVDDDGGYLAELASRLASETDSDSGDLALDLLLHQIVEQACQETGASGAAIALAHDNEIVCRATIGESAPDLGVRLSTRSGLSGTCYQTRQMQVCDDTESDPRVDAAACRQLAILSIVVLPVLDAESGDRLGVFELYASRPRAFQVREIQALQILCRRIAENVRHAAVSASAPVLPGRDSAATTVQAEELKLAAPVPVAARVERPFPDHELPSLAPRIREVPPEVAVDRLRRFQLSGGRRHRDYWTGLLTMIVLGLALLLGWMVGRRASWHQPQPTAVLPAARVATQAAKLPPAPAPPPQMNQAAPSARKVTAPGVTQAVARSVTRSKSGTPENSPGDLVVYEHGKVIFRMAPTGKGAGSAAKPDESAANTGLTIESDSAASGEGPATLSAEAANAYLIQRVAPQYPELAKQQAVQGAVVLDALVGNDGTVREVKVVSGDPQLAPAAIAAVRQWRFRPYTPQGQPVAFTTRVTVNFAIP